MATSMQAMAGQQQQQQAAPAAAAQPTTPLQAPAAQLAAPGDA
jgi:hypothetical protein